MTECFQPQQGMVFVGAMLASPKGTASRAPTNCARGTSDDIDYMTRSLKAHRYGMAVLKSVSKFLGFGHEAQAGFWFLSLTPHSNKKLRNIETYKQRNVPDGHAFPSRSTVKVHEPRPHLQSGRMQSAPTEKIVQLRQTSARKFERYWCFQSTKRASV